MDVSTAGRLLDTDGLADHTAISRLQSAYADVITRRSFDELRWLFLADCAVEVDTVTRPVMSFDGPSAFGAFVSDAVARFDHFEFVILNAVIDLSASAAGEASARIFMCEIRHERGASAEDGWTTAYGRYDDHYRRLGQRWWFAARSYRSMARTGPDGAILGP